MQQTVVYDQVSSEQAGRRSVCHGFVVLAMLLADDFLLVALRVYYRQLSVSPLLKTVIAKTRG